MILFECKGTLHKFCAILQRYLGLERHQVFQVIVILSTCKCFKMSLSLQVVFHTKIIGRKVAGLPAGPVELCPNQGTFFSGMSFSLECHLSLLFCLHTVFCKLRYNSNYQIVFPFCINLNYKCHAYMKEIRPEMVKQIYIMTLV